MRGNALVICALLALCACSKKEESRAGGDKDKVTGKDDKKETRETKKGGNAGGCDRRAGEALCGEYHGNMATPEWVKEQCEYMKVPYVEACPKEKAVGRCVRDAGTAQETQTVWYEPTPKETVAAMCKDGELRDP
jgi:hypothetical protein